MGNPLYDGDGGKIAGQRVQQAQGGTMVTKPEDYVSVAYVSQLLGIGLSTVYAMIEEGNLPAIYLPGKGGRKIVRIKHSDVVCLIESSQAVTKPRLKKPM